MNVGALIGTILAWYGDVVAGVGSGFGPTIEAIPKGHIKILAGRA